ncbi:MAG TPA: 3-oxoacyl-ACP reductase FabG [Longimicrobiales bacterium]
MDLGLHGRSALVTGAAGGIGSAIAVALAQEGCDVALLDAERSAALQVAADSVRQHGVRARLVQADVRDFARAQQVVDEVTAHFGGLDILVCSAGVTRDGVSWKLSEEDWDDVLAVNLKGCFNYARAVVPALRARGGGSIIGIGSINGLRGKFGQVNYAASKAGLIGLAKALAREVGRFGITVNVVAPGMTETPLTAALPAAVRDAAVQESLLGRICAPADIADAVLFLASQRARQITGDVLRVDAGQYV